jgi:enoyl-[acyl-carrier protein] reductase II
VPARLLKNDFYAQVAKAEAEGANRQELMDLLGKGRAKKGMFNGDLVEGELEIGQIASAIHEVKPASQILNELWTEFLLEKDRLSDLKF